MTLKEKERTCERFYNTEFPIFIYFGLLFYLLYTFDTRVIVILLMGLILSSIIIAIQKITKSQRPCTTCRCAECIAIKTGKKSNFYKNGCPSGHAATMFYFATVFSIMCGYSILHSNNPYIYLRLLSILVVYGIAIWIAVSRVLNKCHYGGQVLLGALAGSVYALVTVSLIFVLPYMHL
jgi:hypothetical protein